MGRVARIVAMQQNLWQCNKIVDAPRGQCGACIRSTHSFAALIMWLVVTNCLLGDAMLTEVRNWCGRILAVCALLLLGACGEDAPDTTQNLFPDDEEIAETDIMSDGFGTQVAVATVAETNVGATYRVRLKDGDTLAVYRLKAMHLLKDGRVRAAVDLCTESAADDCARDDQFTTYVSRFRLEDLDFEKSLLFQANENGFLVRQGSMQDRVTDAEEGATFTLNAACADGRACVEIQKGDQTKKETSVILPCRIGGQDGCSNMALLHGLRSLTVTPSYGQAVDKNDPTARFLALVETVDQLSFDQRYATANPLIPNRIARYKGVKTTPEPDGDLRVHLKDCQETYEDNPTGTTNCGWQSSWRQNVTLGRLKDLDPASLRILGFYRDGKPVPPDASDAKFNVAKSFAVIIGCRGQGACVHHQGIGPGERIYIPCGKKAACEKISESVRALTKLASSSDFPSIVADLKKDSFPNYSAADMDTQRRLGRRIGRSFADGSFTFTTDEATVQIAQIDAELNSAASLVIHNQFCSNKVCGGDNTFKDGQTTLSLSAIDMNASTIVTAPGRQPSIRLLCKAGTFCVDYALGKITNQSSSWLLACKDERACGDMLSDLGALVWRASTDRSTDVSPKPQETTVPKTPSATGKIPDRLRGPLRKLRTAVAGGEYTQATSGTGALRLIRADGANLDADEHLLVERKACLSLINKSQPNLSNCSLDSLLVDYDLHVYLERLDPNSVRIEQGAYLKGETGFWVAVKCAAGGPACADIIAPDNQKGHVTTIANSLGENVTRPYIRIPCANTTQCNVAAQALRELMMATGTPAPDPQGSIFQPLSDRPVVTNEFIGTWRMQSPQQGWIWEFNIDGTYRFATEDTQFEGTYKVGNGTWSQKATNFPSEDSGTYRLLDTNTLELNGRLGRSVWTRVQ